MRQLPIVASLMCLLAASAMAQFSVGVNVSYAIVGGDVTLNEPVFLEFSVENRLPETIVVDPGGHNYDGFRMSVTRPDGSVVGPPPNRSRGDYDGLEVSGVVSVPPLKTYARRLVLNRWFAFDTPGRYTVDVELTNPIRVNGAVAPYPAARRIAFTVGGRDPARLVALCEDLQRRVAPGKPDRLDAAEGLSYVNDPVAVPYLKAMLSPTGEDWYAIDGLARIGDAAAADALISQSHYPDIPARAFILGSLARIEARTQDETLKQRIREMLPQAEAGIEAEGKAQAQARARARAAAMSSGTTVAK